MTGVGSAGLDQAESRAHSGYAWRLLSVVCLASVTSGLSHSSLVIALPTIVGDLDASAAQATWVLLGFQLTNVVLLVFFGRLADVFGRRPMYLGGMAVFTLSSLAAGAAPTIEALIALRAVQAVGAAMLLTNSAALLTSAFPRHLLGQGLGIYMGSFALAQLLGPSLGGLVTTEWGWRWTMYMVVPLGVLCFAWGWTIMERTPRSTERFRPDLAGNLLLVLGLGGLLVALSQSGSGWADPVVWGGLLAFVVAVPLFLLVERKVEQPVVALTIFREPVIGIGVLGAFLGSMARFSVVLLLGLYFQIAQGDTPAQAGVKILPLAMASIVSSPLAGIAMRRVRARTVAMSSAAITLAGLGLLLIVLDETTPYWVLTTAVVVIGLGGGAYIPANSTATLQDLPADRVGVTNAVRLMAQGAGVVVSTAVSLLLLALPLAPELRSSVLEGSLAEVAPAALPQLVDGFRAAIGLMALMAALCVVTSAVGRRTAPAIGAAPRPRTR